MKRTSLSRIALVVALFSLAPAMGSAEAATSLSKTLTVGVDDDASFVVESKSGWIVGGTTFESSESSTVFTEKPMGGSDIWVTQLDASLNSLWSHRVGSSKNDIAGGVTLDVNGNIWIIGTSQIDTSTASPVVMTTLPPPSLGPTTAQGIAPITVNPDGVSLTSPLVAAPSPLNQLTIQGLRSDGSALLKSSINFGEKYSILPTGVVSDVSGLWIAGTILTLESKSSRGFYLYCDFALQCKAPIFLGKSATSIRTLALNSGVLLVAGSTNDPWKGKPAIGKVDALALVINAKSGAITQTQRSGNTGTRRSWESSAIVNGEALLAGTVDYGKKMEIVTTTFAKAGAVSSTGRWLGAPRVALAPRGSGSLALAFSVSPNELKAISPTAKAVGSEVAIMSLMASKTGKRALKTIYLTPRSGDQELFALGGDQGALLAISGSGGGQRLLDRYPDSGSGAVKR